MSTTQIDGAAVSPKAHVHFDGRRVSPSITLADSYKASAGVILPATLGFGSRAPENIKGVARACEYRLPGTITWQRAGVGDKFNIPGNTPFASRVTPGVTADHDICCFG